MVKGKDSVSFPSGKSKILHSRYTFPILLNIYHGYRPSQIANKLGVSARSINYYTDNLIDLKLIEKVGDRQGLVWKLTPQGDGFFLQRTYTGHFGIIDYHLEEQLSYMQEQSASLQTIQSC